MKISVPCAPLTAQSASLPGRRKRRVAVWRPISFSFLRRSRSSERSTTQSSRRLAWLGLPVSQWSKASRSALSTMRAASGARQPVLGLALELRLADEHREHGGGGAEHVVGRHLRHALVAGQLAIAAQALGERRAQAGLMGAAVGRRHGVAIGAEEPVIAGDPGDRPFDRARAFGLLDAAGEDFLGDGLLAFDAVGRESP